MRTNTTTKEIIKILINAKYGLHASIMKKVRREGNKMINRKFTAECLKVDEVFTIRYMLRKMHYIMHHEASMRGYISRKWDAGICEYSGRFGEGYLLVYPRWDTTNYVYVEYWVKEED